MTNQAVLKQDTKNKDFSYLYFKSVPVIYASVQEPKKKYQSTDKEYAVTIFVTEETKTFLEEDVLLNKTLYKVGVDKNKKRKIKFPLSSQVDSENDMNYDDYKGLYGLSLSLNEKRKNGKTNTLIVVDEAGNPFTDLVGNGSICSIKCFGYRNEDELLVVSLNIVQVLEHVPYEGGSGVIEDDELGITVQRPEAKEESSPEPVTTVDDDDIPF